MRTARGHMRHHPPVSDATNRVKWFVNPQSKKMLSNVAQPKSGKYAPYTSGPNASWMRASTTSKYAGFTARFSTSSSDRWWRNGRTMDAAIYDPGRRSPAIFAPVATIALNGRLLISGRLEGIGGFAEACFRRIVQAHPEHTFVLVRDRSVSWRKFLLAQLAMPVGAVAAVVFVFWITKSGMKDIGGAIDLIVLLGIAVAGAVGLAILVYTVQSLLRPPGRES